MKKENCFSVKLCLLLEKKSMLERAMDDNQVCNDEVFSIAAEDDIDDYDNGY